MPNVEILHGNALQVVDTLEDNSIQTVVTSPPYWGLRDYGVDEQIGLESSPQSYINNLVLLFERIKRVLKDDGTVWINIGDCYVGKSWSGSGNVGSDLKGRRGVDHKKQGENLKPKDLVGIPWMLAFAMREAGWYLRCDIVWAKPNPVPEPVKDRPTRAHEFIFLFSKNKKYYYDYLAAKEKGKDGNMKNARDVWWISPRQYRGEHVAVFPFEIPERCIIASTREGDTVLDPFVGSGTVCEVAKRLNRDSIGIELNERYYNIASQIMKETTLEDFNG